MENNTNQEEPKPRLKPIIEAADDLSLGISIVVAILIGVGLGMGLKKAFGHTWLLWLGIFIGIAAAILNVYKAYSKQYKEYEALAKERNDRLKPHFDDDEDEEDYGGGKI